jgi:hypothetical protein
VLAASVGLGLLGDALLRETPWGLNVPVWVAAVALAAVALGLAPQRAAKAWLALAVGLAACVAWRASPVLAALNLAAALTAIGLAVRQGAYGFRLRSLGGELVAGPAVLATREVEWGAVRDRGPRLAAAARGFAIAVPLVLVFGGLFAAADAVFAELVAGAFDVDDGPTHLLALVGCAWTGAALLRHLARRREEPEPGERRQPLGTTEVAVALAVVDLLFLLFVAVQLRYLFGGAEHVQETVDLTYAEYAHRGFFELVAVAVLAGALLLATARLAPRTPVIGLCSSLLVGLVLVVVASALERLRVYVDAYGLTELRLYVAAFVLWTAAALVWLAATVLRGRPERFVAGATAAALAGVVVLNALDPDGTIARTNTSRGELDVAYVASLSSDAVPELVEALPRLPAPERFALERALERRDDDAGGLRSWNLGRRRAEDSLEALHQSSGSGVDEAIADARSAGTREALAGGAGLAPAAAQGFPSVK